MVNQIVLGRNKLPRNKFEIFQEALILSGHNKDHLPYKRSEDLPAFSHMDAHPRHNETGNSFSWILSKDIKSRDRRLI